MKQANQVWKVTAHKPRNFEVKCWVLANSLGAAIRKAKRWMKREGHSGYRVVIVEMLGTIDAF